MSFQNGFQRLGRATYNHRWGVILLWVIVVVLLKSLAPSWSEVARDGDLKHLPDETTVVRAGQLSAQAFPDDRANSQIVLVFARPNQKLSVEDRQFAYGLGRNFEQMPELPVVDVWTEKTAVVGPLLKSRLGNATRVVIRLTTEFMATENILALQKVEQTILTAQYEAPTGLEIGISGSATVGGDMLSAAAESVASTHQMTLLLVTVALLAIYRSPRLVLVPLITIGVAASASIDLLALLAYWSQQHPEAWPAIRIFTTTKIFVIVLLFGAGTDYCMFLTARYREERSEGLAVGDALAAALEGVGSALAASALTTIVGLAMMGWADFGKFTYSGPAIAICLAVTLVACLTLVPALLATWLGAALGKSRVAAGSDPRRSIWERLSEPVLRRPGIILVVSLLLAFPLAKAGWSVGVTYDLLGELSSSRVSRRGTELLRRHFPAGEIGPLVVLARHPVGELDSVDGGIRIAELAKPLDDLPGVAQVRSYYRPMGNPPGSTSVFSSKGWLQLAAKESPITKSAFVSQTGEFAGHVTRLFLILTDEPFSAEAVKTCDEVEQVLDGLSADPDGAWQGATFELLGPTAGIRDLEKVTVGDRRRIQVLVAGAVLLVILVLLRRPVVCFFLIATVLLSYLVTMGITTLVFESLRGEHYVGLDWKVPLFLFVILVAVGQDYNIYLVSRVFEEQRRLGAREGLRHAMIQTGGIITSCGIIMVGTFVSMTSAQLNGMVELGFALSLGILLDTFVVRTILVPAFLALLAKRAAESPAA